MRSLVLLTALFLFAPTAPCLAAGDWGWPVRGQVLTEFRNGGDPYAAGQHRGVDVGAPVGTSVVAPVAGTVEFAGSVGSSGLVVSERTADGRYQLSYLHLSSVAVHRGDAVARGDRVGAVGMSGTRSVDAPHLHFGVREAGDRHAYLDPLDFLAPPPAEAPQPRALPVPVSEPVAASPEPAPSPVPGSAFAPAPAGSPAPVRTVYPAPHLTLAPRVHHAQPHRAPAPGGPGHVARPVRADTPAHGSPSHHVAKPASGPAGGAARPAPQRAHVAAAAPRHHGVDAGWLAACLGLVVAATLLAAPSRRGWNFRALIAAIARSERRPPPVAFDPPWPTTSRPRSTT